MERALPVSVGTWHWMIEQGVAPKRAELLRGVIIEKMPKSILHIQLVTRILRLLQDSLGTGFWVRPEAPLTTRDSEPEPDVSVVPGRDSDYREHPNTAKLVVEVSVSSLAENREMALIYAEAAVEEYWIINAADRSIEIHREPREGRFRTTETRCFDEVWICKSLPQVTVDVARLFADLPEAR